MRLRSRIAVAGLAVCTLVASGAVRAAVAGRVVTEASQLNTTGANASAKAGYFLCGTARTDIVVEWIKPDAWVKMGTDRRKLGALDSVPAVTVMAATSDSGQLSIVAMYKVNGVAQTRDWSSVMPLPCAR
jgi:hypothetical protein